MSIDLENRYYNTLLTIVIKIIKYAKIHEGFQNISEWQPRIRFQEHCQITNKILQNVGRILKHFPVLTPLDLLPKITDEIRRILTHSPG